MNLLRKGLVAVVLLGLGVSVGRAQTTVAGSVYGAFRSSAKAGNISSLTVAGSSTMERPSDAAGVLLEVRHIWNPLMGVEATYSYSRANEAYSSTVAEPPCSTAGVVPCGLDVYTSASVPANAHEVTADWVVSLPLGNLKPFALVGGGLLFHIPASGSATATTTSCAETHALCSLTTGMIPTRTETKGVFQYGAGLDWTLLPHIGLRFQYRGNVYKAADLSSAFTSTDKFTQDAEPMAGVFIRF